MRVFGLRTVMGVLVSCLISGCAYVGSGPYPEPSQPLVFAKDVPKLPGFELDPSLSWRHEREGFRRVELLYRSQGAVPDDFAVEEETDDDYVRGAEARKLVKQGLVRRGWQLGFVYGMHDTKMLFTKQGEECLVTVSERPLAFRTEVQFQIRPRGA